MRAALRVKFFLFAFSLIAGSGAAAGTATDPATSSPFKVADASGQSISLFSLEAYRAEFRYLRSKFRQIDLRGPPVITDGWTTNIAEAEWPVMSFAYLGLACANLAELDPDAAMRKEYVAEMRWLLEALQTNRISGFMRPHFGEPFGEDQIHVAVFLHGHVLNLATRYYEVSHDFTYWSLINRVAKALTNEFHATEQGILRSYRDMWWITDNFPALSALARYDRLFKSDTSDVRTKFLESLRSYYLNKRTGLYCTYVHPETHSQSQGPRGISVMYGLHFLKDFDPRFAAEEYSLAKKYLIRDVLGVSAAREFPEGAEAAGDIDSGPVIFGLGLSASGFAIPAAVINGDTNTAQRLLNASTLAGLPILQNGELRYQAMPPVGQSVILYGKTELLRVTDPPSLKQKAAVLVDQLESRYRTIVRDSSGSVIQAHVSWDFSRRENLELLPQLDALRILWLQVHGKDFGREEAQTVARLTNLTELQIACGFNLQLGVADEISRLRSLRSLTLYYSRPQEKEYSALTNLSNLENLRLIDCTNFTDAQLNLLTNFPKLTNLEITYCQVHGPTNVLGSLTNLKHLVIYKDKAK